MRFVAYICINERLFIIEGIFLRLKKGNFVSICNCNTYTWKYKRWQFGLENESQARTCSNK